MSIQNIFYSSLFVILFCSQYLIAQDFTPAPERFDSYRRFINTGSIEHPQGFMLHGANAYNFVHQAYNWVNALAENTQPNLLPNLEKNSLLAKLLIDHRLRLQHFGLIQGEQALVAAAFACQLRFTELFLVQAPLEQGQLKKLRQHAYIWWAILSIKRTHQGYQQAWNYLNRVQVPPYTKVAKLWQAHLIVRNNYSPSANRGNDLHAATLLLNWLEPPIHDPMEGNNNLLNHPAADNAQHQLLHDLHDAQGQLIQNAANQNVQLNDENPNPPPPAAPPEALVHPDYCNTPAIQLLKNQLRNEIADEQAAMAHDDNGNDNNSDGSSSSSSSSDDDSDDDDPNLGNLAIINNNNNHENPNSDDDQSDEKKPLASFLELFPAHSHDDIEKLTVEFLESGVMPTTLKSFLEQNHNNVTRIESSAPKMRRHKLTPIKQERNSANLLLVRLMYHHSQTLLAKSKVNRCFIAVKVFNIFKHHFVSVKFSATRNLFRYYSFSESKKKHNKSIFYTSLLAYRSEIKSKKISTHKVTQHCNAKYGTSFSKINVDFIDKELVINPTTTKQILLHYKNDGVGFVDDLDNRTSEIKLSEALYVLWHDLSDQELPAKDLEDFNQKNGFVTLTGKERTFLKDFFASNSDDLNMATLRKGVQDFNRLFKRTITMDHIRTWKQIHDKNGSKKMRGFSSHEEIKFLRDYLDNNERTSFDEFLKRFEKEFNKTISRSAYFKNIRKLKGPSPSLSGSKRSSVQDDTVEKKRKG